MSTLPPLNVNCFWIKIYPKNPRKILPNLLTLDRTKMYGEWAKPMHFPPLPRFDTAYQDPSIVDAMNKVIDILKEVPDMGMSFDLITFKLEANFGFNISQRIVAIKGIREGVRLQKIEEISKVSKKFNCILRSYILVEQKEVTEEKETEK